MMVRKLFSVLAIILSLFAIASLFLPIYSTNLTDGEACNLIVKGYNLVEFSPWGGVVILAPLVLLGVMLSKLNDTIKTIGLLGLFTLNGVALCGSTSAAYKWICDVSNGFVQPHMNHLIYALLFFCATICFYIINNVCWGDAKMKIDDLFGEILDEEKPAEMLNDLVDKIVIHAPDKSSGKRRQKIEIYYKAAGIINIYSDDCISIVTNRWNRHIL